MVGNGVERRKYGANPVPVLAAIYLVAILSFAVVPRALAQSADSRSLDEVNKELSNPISSIWALQLQENTYWFIGRNAMS